MMQKITEKSYKPTEMSNISQQIIIDVPPQIRFAPEIIADAKQLEREVYFSELVAKEFMTEPEMLEYKAFLNEFITEDDEPVDNIISEKNQKLLTRSLYASWKPVDANGKPREFVTVANVGIFTRLNPAVSVIVPDVLVSLDVELGANFYEKEMRSYMVWEFGKLPEIVVEIVSNHIGDELTEKVVKYERIGIKYYAVYDPEKFLSDEVLQIFELTKKGYRRRKDSALPETGLRLTLWNGTFENWEREWLRFTDSNGNLLLTGEENSKIEAKRADSAEQRADSAEQRAEKLAEKLRELGLNPNEI